jgi:hypothetical protein
VFPPWLRILAALTGGFLFGSKTVYSASVEEVLMAPDEARVALRLEFNEERPLAALDLSAFIFDLNRLYVETYRLIGAPGIATPSSQRGRYAFLLPKDDQLAMKSIRFESPGLMEFVGIAEVLFSALNFIVASATWLGSNEKIDPQIRDLRRTLGVGDRFHRIDPPPLTPPDQLSPVLYQLKNSNLQPINVTINIIIPPLDPVP